MKFIFCVVFFEFVCFFVCALVLCCVFVYWFVLCFFVYFVVVLFSMWCSILSLLDLGSWILVDSRGRAGDSFSLLVCLFLFLCFLVSLFFLLFFLLLFVLFLCCVIVGEAQQLHRQPERNASSQRKLTIHCSFVDIVPVGWWGRAREEGIG